MRFSSIKYVLLVIISAFLVSAKPVGYPRHHFMAYIIQDGIQLPIMNHVVKVKRKPFDIIIDMPDKEGVFVNASFLKKTYKQGMKNVMHYELQGFMDAAVYEYWRNPFNELLISDNKPNYWFIDSRLEHKFSDYEWVNERYICVRHVNSIYDTDVHRNRSLESLNMSVYLTFIKFSISDSSYRNEELMRHEFKIEWVD